MSDPAKGLNVSLIPELRRFVQSKVASGLYQTASEVVREALRLMRNRDGQRSAEADSKESERPDLAARPFKGREANR